LDPSLKETIEKFREGVPELMKEGKIRGVAIALVDHQGLLWAEGFGYADLKKRIPVTTSTPFLIGGISQLLTAVAIMRGVENGWGFCLVRCSRFAREGQLHVIRKQAVNALTSSAKSDDPGSRCECRWRSTRRSWDTWRRS
jgi:hypothetical protein